MKKGNNQMIVPKVYLLYIWNVMNSGVIFIFFLWWGSPNSLHWKKACTCQFIV